MKPGVQLEIYYKTQDVVVILLANGRMVKLQLKA